MVSSDPRLQGGAAWLNPVEMLWRHVHREVTQRELLANAQAPFRAPTESFAWYRRAPERVRSLIGSHLG